jgi:aerobic carbon-monoxide dehydrogenase large subunit
MDVSLTVNGTTRTVDVEPRSLLADVLRDRLGLTGTKIGCETGECGACTVHLDGAAVKSCLVLAPQAAGHDVTTIEGMAGADGSLHPIQDAFWREFAAQNGFSTPGMIMAVADLLNRNPDPSDAEIRAWMDGTLTRISGYQNAVKAVHTAAAAMRTAGAPADGAPPAGGAAPAGVAAPAAAPAGPGAAAAPVDDGIGVALLTKEGPGLVRGEAEYVGDITPAGTLHAAILFSDRAHALIKGIDTAMARAMPGVVGVFTADDIAGLMPMPVVWVPKDVESHFPPHPSGMVPGGQSLLAKDRVRFVGDQLAVIVAETRQGAFDALDAITVTYEPLPVVTDAEAALKPGAPQLHDAVPNNLMLHWSTGDKAAADQAIADAEVVIQHRFVNQRMMSNTVETRGSLAQYDPSTGDYTLWSNIQPTYPVRLLISLYVLGIPYSKLRVIVPASGGSQGSKGYLYADAPLMLHLSKVLGGRPVKWIDTRAGLARSTVQGRDQVQDVTLAGTRDGTITALSVTAYSNIGAYPVINAPGQPTVLIGRSITGQYAIAHPFYEVSIVYTNTVPAGPLRGSGRAEATFLTERIVDLYAAEIGMDPAEVRRRNQVKPDAFPYDNHLGWTYDTGDYPLTLEKALATAGYGDLADRRADAKGRGKRLGVGIGSYVAVAGVGPSAQMGAAGLVSGTWGSAIVRVQPSGEVTITTGAQPHGQSQETTFAQIAADGLGIPAAMISVAHSDTSGALYFGQASYGSRSLSVEGTAVHLAVEKVKAKAIQLVSHLFKAPPEALVFENGGVHVVGNPAQGMTLQQIAFVLWLAWDLPEGMDPALEASAYFDPPNFNYPFGTHVAVVEVDEGTGQVDLVRYVAVDDFGVVVNPAVVDGQTHGNIALGVGQALLEQVVYDDDGGILTDSYGTYPIPRASMLPEFETERTVTPSTANPLGVKGAGDVSNPPVAPAIVNAICDALSDLGVRSIDMPATPEKVWRAMQPAK